MPYEFDTEKYKKILNDMYGAGAYESGISRASKLGQLKGQAIIAKQAYKQRMQMAARMEREAEAAAKKAAREAEAKRKKEEAQRAKASLDFNKQLVKNDKLHEKNKPALDLLSGYNRQKKSKPSGKAAKGILHTLESPFQILWHDAKSAVKTGKHIEQAINPFDKVSAKQALKAEQKDTKKYYKESDSGSFIHSKSGKEVNRGLNRFLDSATLGGYNALAKANGDKKPQFSQARSGGLNKALDFTSTGLGYLIPGAGVAKAGKALKIASASEKGLLNLGAKKSIAKLGSRAAEGAFGGAAFETANQGMKAVTDPKHYNVTKGLESIAAMAAVGAVADPALHAIGVKAGNVLKALKQNRIGADIAHTELTNLDHEVKAVAPEKQVSAALDHAPANNKAYEAISSGSPGIHRLTNAEQNALRNKETFANNNDGKIPNTMGHIVSKTKIKRSAAEAKDIAFNKLIDNLSPLNKFDKTVERVTGHPLKPSESSYTLGLNSRGADMISKQVLVNKMVDSKGNVVGNSLKDIARKIPNHQLSSFEDYLVNKHAITRMKRGEKVFPDELKMSPEKSQHIVKQYEQKYPDFKQLAKEYYDYNNKLGQHWLVDTGILTKDEWQGYLKSNPHYVPNNRVFSDMEKKVINQAKRGFANQSNPVKKAVGSQRKIVSPIESTIEHTAQYIKTAKRNEVMQTVIKNIRKDPEAFKGWAEIVPTEKTSQNIKDTLQKEGVNGVLENLNKGFDQKPDLTHGNIVTGIIDGKKVHVRVHDPHLLDAITNLNPKAQNLVVHAVGQVTRIMKNLTTGINPVFGLTRNIFRDIPTAYINSKSTNNPAVFAKDLVGALISVMKNDKLYQEFKNMGGGHSSPISSDVNLLAQSKRAILPNKGVRPFLGKGIGTLENLNNAVEAAPRLSEYKRLSKSGTYDSKVKGLFEANDLTTNFNKYGNVGKEIDAFIPYFNAALQGLEKFRTAFRDNPMTTSVKAFAAITIPSILLYVINHKDPNFKLMSNYIKDNNFLIPKGDGTFIKIPKPRELGVVFGSDVERFLREWNDNDPKAFDEFSNTLWNNFKPPLRTITAPLNDIRANKNFMGAPIVPGDLQNLSPRYQYDSRTSEPAKRIGDVLNISPKKIDYATQSYTGILGELGIPATTKNTTIGQTLKQKVTADPVFSNDLMNRFYELKTKLDQAHSDLTKQGVQTKNLNEPLRKMIDNKSRSISDIRKKIKSVQNDQSMTADQRQYAIRNLTKQMNQIVIDTMGR